MNYKRYWNNKEDLSKWLKAVDDLKNINYSKYESINITAKVYKNDWKIPLNEARALALALRGI